MAIGNCETDNDEPLTKLSILGNIENPLMNYEQDQTRFKFIDKDFKSEKMRDIMAREEMHLPM